MYARTGREIMIRICTGPKPRGLSYCATSEEYASIHMEGGNTFAIRLCG